MHRIRGLLNRLLILLDLIDSIWVGALRYPDVLQSAGNHNQADDHDNECDDEQNDWHVGNKRAHDCTGSSHTSRKDSSLKAVDV